MRYRGCLRLSSLALVMRTVEVAHIHELVRNHVVAGVR